VGEAGRRGRGPLTEPLCPRCRERPRRRSASGALQGYCQPCASEKARAGRPRSARRLSFAPARAGLAHVVEEVRFGPGRWTLCRCGERLDGFRLDQEMADAFQAHAVEGNRRA
jgi:hypothetical protein